MENKDLEKDLEFVLAFVKGMIIGVSIILVLSFFVGALLMFS